MKIHGLCIDFPEIDGVSQRQIWYAEKLRQLFIDNNYNRFEEIDEVLQLELDNRFRFEKGEYLNSDFSETYKLEFSDLEKIVLFCESAGMIISKLKTYEAEVIN